MEYTGSRLMKKPRYAFPSLTRDPGYHFEIGGVAKPFQADDYYPDLTAAAEQDANRRYNVAWDGYANTRVATSDFGMLSLGIGKGSTAAGERTFNDCQPGEMRFSEILDPGTNRLMGYNCSTVNIDDCPRVGGYAAVSARFRETSTSGQPLNNNTLMLCTYPKEAFSQPTSYADWNSAYIQPLQTAAEIPAREQALLENESVRDRFIMGYHCKQITTVCRVHADGTAFSQCTRFDSSEPDGEDCRRWGADPLYSEQYDSAVASHCGVVAPDGTFPAECECYHKEENETYNIIVNEEEGINLMPGLEAGCWFTPCSADPSQLVLWRDRCTAENVNVCFNFVSAPGNEGIVAPGDITCVINDGGGDGGDDDEDGGDGGDDEENPKPPPGADNGEFEWSDVSTWPWWLWLIIVVGAIIVMVIIGAIAYSLLGGTSSATSMTPTTTSVQK